MSTKTTFKRIALVAVAALGLGVLSVAPSQAIVGTLSVTTADATGALTGARSDSTTAATISISALLDGGSADSVSVTFAVKSAPNAATVANVLTFLETNTSTTSVVDTNTAYTSAGRTTYVASESLTAGTGYLLTTTSSSAAYAGAKFGLYQESISSTNRIAGSYVYTFNVKTYNAGVYKDTFNYDVTITIGAATAVSTTPAAAKEWSVMSATAQPNADAVDSVITGVATVGELAGYLSVGVRNASDAETAQDSVTASITGPGVLCYGTTCGKSFLIASTGDADFTIKADGTAGVATIATKTNTVTFANKSVTFYAKAAKTITATVATPVLGIGANGSAVAVSAVDANGTAWTGTAYIVASAAADALVGGSATTPVQCSAYNSTTGILCPVTTIAAGTAKFKVIDASTVALATATSNEVTVTASAEKAATVKIAFDKASYAPFEKATITVTPLDAAGKGLPAQTAAALLADGGISSTYAFSAGSDTLTASLITTSATSSASAGTVAGSKTYVVYMPAASGDVTISATGGTALSAAGQVKVSATASVVNSSVDAATDASTDELTTEAVAETFTWPAAYSAVPPVAEIVTSPEAAGMYTTYVFDPATVPADAEDVAEVVINEAVRVSLPAENAYVEEIPPSASNAAAV